MPGSSSRSSSTWKDRARSDSHGGEVRCYYPDAKVVRIEPPEFRNAFPTLSPQQQKALTRFLRRAQGRGRSHCRHATLRRGCSMPKDGIAFGHKLWTDLATGLLLKAALVNERNEPRRAVHVSRYHDRRPDRPMIGRVDWPAPRRPIGRCRMPTAADAGRSEHGMGRDRVCRRLLAHRRRLPHRCTANGARRAHRLFGRPRRRLGVRRAAQRAAAQRRRRAAGRRSTSSCASWTTTWSPCLARRPRATLADLPSPSSRR